MTFPKIEACLPSEALLNPPELPFKHINSGKVREIYDLQDKLLIIATDRLSAFDVIMPNGVPGKGILLTQISLWWFAQAESIMPHHLVDNHDEALREVLKDFPELVTRSMLVKKLNPLPLEAVVRGYLAGSGWKAYCDTGKLFDLELPANMLESEQLPSVLFTPTTKANEGHDMPVSADQAREIVGDERFDAIETATFKLFAMGTRKAQSAGIILADTKFEFGTDEGGQLYLIDEVLTPDSSRYWPANDYVAGRPQHAFDKQFVRDYLETLDWNKQPPAPTLPEAVIKQTRERYLSALSQLMSSL